MDEALNSIGLTLPLPSPYILTKLKEGTYHQGYGHIRKKANTLMTLLTTLAVLRE